MNDFQLDTAFDSRSSALYAFLHAQAISTTLQVYCLSFFAHAFICLHLRDHAFCFRL